ELALELGADRGAHAQAMRLVADRAQQRRLARARRALDQRDPAAAVARVGDQGTQRVEFRFAFQKLYVAHRDHRPGTVRAGAQRRGGASLSSWGTGNTSARV